MHKELIWDQKIILLVSHQATVDTNTSESLVKQVRLELVTYGEKFYATDAPWMHCSLLCVVIKQKLRFYLSSLCIKS